MKPKEFRDKGIQKVREINLEVDLDWQNWDNFFREVIDPLREEDTLDLKIIESLNQEGLNGDLLKMDKLWDLNTLFY